MKLYETSKVRVCMYSLVHAYKHVKLYKLINTIRVSVRLLSAGPSLDRPRPADECAIGQKDQDSGCCFFSTGISPPCPSPHMHRLHMMNQLRKDLHSVIPKTGAVNDWSEWTSSLCPPPPPPSSPSSHLSLSVYKTEFERFSWELWEMTA